MGRAGTLTALQYGGELIAGKHAWPPFAIESEDLDGETLAALGAARSDHSAPTLGLHADQEAVGAFTAHDGRLVSAFHDAVPLDKPN